MVGIWIDWDWIVGYKIQNKNVDYFIGIFFIRELFLICLPCNDGQISEKCMMRYYHWVMRINVEIDWHRNDGEIVLTVKMMGIELRPMIGGQHPGWTTKSTGQVIMWQEQHQKSNSLKLSCWKLQKNSHGLIQCLKRLFTTTSYFAWNWY